MGKYRYNLPQLTDTLFLTDGGLETTLFFHEKIELPGFAAITLLDMPGGRQRLLDYFHRYLPMAERYDTGFILESATWRGGFGWAERLGYSRDRYAALNREAVSMLFALRKQYETGSRPVVISGCMGPMGDGYDPADAPGIEPSRRYHRDQIAALADAGADLVTPMTLPAVDEAIGMTHAANEIGIPIVLSFTVETDGRLPDGSTLQQAVERVDAQTDTAPAYYMLNCAHPSHFIDALRQGDGWQQRIRGIRANASCKSHAELDNSTELDPGDPRELGDRYRELFELLPALRVLGGCCGTDHRHIEAIASQLIPCPGD